MLKTVFGIARSEKIVTCTVDTLLDTGISGDEISLLFPVPASVDDAHQLSRGANFIKADSNDYAVKLAAGLLVIPGVGPFMATGPIRTALSSPSMGAMVGGISGGLIRLGIPEYDAKIYVDKIKNGNTLIAAPSRDVHLARHIKALFKTMGLEDIGMDCRDAFRDGRQQIFCMRSTYPAIRP